MKIRPIALALALVLAPCIRTAWADPLADADKAWFLGNVAKAISLYRTPALAGDVTAQRRLGNVYSTPWPDWQPDHQEAARWYRMAAAQDDSEAEDSLGALYLNGAGVGRNYAEALKWFRRSAEGGWYMARYHLGVMYAGGFGLKQDYVRAYMWFTLIADADGLKAEAARAEVAPFLTPDQIAEAQRMSEECELRNFSTCD